MFLKGIRFKYSNKYEANGNDLGKIMYNPCVVFDTCAMIAIIKNKIENGPIASLPVNINALVSVITRIELLSYPDLSASEAQQIRMLLKNDLR